MRARVARALAALAVMAACASCSSAEDRAARRRLDAWLAQLDARDAVPLLCDDFAAKAAAFRRAGCDAAQVRRFEALCAHDAPVAWATRELAAAAANERAPACEGVALALLELPDEARARERALVDEARRRCCGDGGDAHPAAALRAPCRRLAAGAP
jgi:hypothetical protein